MINPAAKTARVPLVAAILVAVAFGSASALARDAAKPNVVVILADDLGYGDLACYGGTAPTPNADRVAREGLQFHSGYASSATCTPSRYSLLTGQYAWRKKGTGILPGDAALIITPGSLTVPAIFQRAGYKTGAVGKWHLGLGTVEHPADWNGEIKPGPLDVGFDYSFIMAATADRVPCVYIEDRKVVGLNPDDRIAVDYNEPFPGVPTYHTTKEPLKYKSSHGHDNAVINGIGRIGYMKGGKDALWVDEDLSKVFTAHAVSFIEKHKDDPFFLYFCTHDVHVPRVPNQDFAGKTTMGPRGDAIVEFDWQVGQILATLDKLHLADDTLLIVTSDNGPVLDDGYVDDANEKLGDHKPAGPFRGGKYSRFEGGTRVPFLVRWPGHVKPGTTTDAMVSQVDFAATFAALTHEQVDPKSSPDSTNVLPALLGESKTGRDHVVEHANRLAIRQGDWKFIPAGPITDHLGPWKRFPVPVPGYLFNLADDPAEQHDLAATNREKRDELASRLDAVKKAGGVAAQAGE